MNSARAAGSTYRSKIRNRSFRLDVTVWCHPSVGVARNRNRWAGITNVDLPVWAE